MLNYYSLTDGELLKQIAGRDRDVIAFVYDKYAAAIYGTILQNVQSTTEADTILCDTFVKFFNGESTELFPTRSIFIQLRNLALIIIKKQVLSISRSPLHLDFTTLFKVNMQR